MMTDKKYYDTLAAAVEVLKAGGTILYPTDTVWGLGCDATDPEAVAKIFAIKNRPDSKSLVLLVSDLDMLTRYVRQIPGIALDLIEVNDKPMTLIYPGALHAAAPENGGAAPKGDRFRLAYNTVAEDESVGIRIPMSDFCRDLCRKLGRPVVSTSANVSGEPSPVRFVDIAERIKSAVDYVVPAEYEKGATGQASQIIKVGLGGEVEIIRK